MATIQNKPSTNNQQSRSLVQKSTITARSSLLVAVQENAPKAKRRRHSPPWGRLIVNKILKQRLGHSTAVRFRYNEMMRFGKQFKSKFSNCLPTIAIVIKLIDNRRLPILSTVVATM